MGAGIAYQYTHHVLVDYYGLTEQVDEDGNPVEPEEYDNDLAAEYWDEFKEQVLACFGAEEILVHEGRESYLFGETDRLYIGCDYSGADSTSCIYLRAKTWERTRKEFGWTVYNEFDYNINRDAERGFNKLIKLYGNLIEYWINAWQAKPYGPQKDGRYVKYGRKG